GETPPESVALDAMPFDGQATVTVLGLPRGKANYALLDARKDGHGTGEFTCAGTSQEIEIRPEAPVAPPAMGEVTVDLGPTAAADVDVVVVRDGVFATESLTRIARPGGPVRAKVEAGPCKLLVRKGGDVGVVDVVIDADRAARCAVPALAAGD